MPAGLICRSFSDGDVSRSNPASLTDGHEAKLLTLTMGVQAGGFYFTKAMLSFKTALPSTVTWTSTPDPQMNAIDWVREVQVRNGEIRERGPDAIWAR
jgi:hypothetical protein